MTSVNVQGHGEFQASEDAVIGFLKADKKEMAKNINAQIKGGVSFWRSQSKDVLAVVSAHLANLVPPAAAEPELGASEGITVVTGRKKTKVAAPAPAGPSCTSLDHIYPAGPAGTKCYCGEKTFSVDSIPEPTPAPAEPVVSHTETVAKMIKSAAPKKDTGAPGATYVLKVATGYLRRDQPRKPGDVAVFKIVAEQARASVYKSLHQAQAKLTEATSLLPGHPAQLAEVDAAGLISRIL